MAKDPAVLFYINDWLVSTAGMDADCRGWYLNLLLHNYDKKNLPNDMEKLAVLCNVKFSEFERFKQVFEQVFKQKFEVNPDGTLTNEKAKSILQARETFKDKRSEAGKKSYLSKFFQKNYPSEFKKKSIKKYVLERIDLKIDLKNEQVIKQVFEHLFELYRNEIENENKDIIEVYRKFSHLSISVNEFEELKQIGYSKTQIDDILDKIENYRQNKKYSSLKLTARNWLKTEFPNVENKKAQSNSEFKSAL